MLVNILIGVAIASMGLCLLVFLGGLVVGLVELIHDTKKENKQLENEHLLVKHIERNNTNE